MITHSPQSMGGKANGLRLRGLAIERYLKNPSICKNCNQMISVKEKQKTREAKRKRFFDRKCSTIFNNSKRFKMPRAIKLKKPRVYLLPNLTKEFVFLKSKNWQTARGIIRQDAARSFNGALRKKVGIFKPSNK